MATSFNGGRSRSTRRELPTMGMQATGKLYHLQLRVECIPFVIYKAGREPIVVLVIGLYELLGNPTT